MSIEYAPLYARLRKSTIEAAKEAQQRSDHRTLASWVDAALRREAARQRDITPDRHVAALTENAAKIGA